MKAALIGSRAYKETDFNDTDILCDLEWKQAWDKTYGGMEEPRTDGRYDSITSKYETCEGIYEVIVPPPGSTAADLLEMSEEWTNFAESDGSPNPHVRPEWLPEGLTLKRTPHAFLAALKKAHLILPSSSPAKWRRQMEEYCEIKRLLYDGTFLSLVFPGCMDSFPHVKAIYEKHRRECLARQKKPPKLNQDKQGFFGEESYEVFEHDDIHVALAYPKEPAYLSMKDGEVWCSRKKWDALLPEEQLRCVVEEASVLALERSVIPHLFLGQGYRGARWAYETAMMKLATTISSGWFRDHVIESWSQSLSCMPDFVGRFFDGVKRGAVRCKRPEVLK